MLVLKRVFIKFIWYVVFEKFFKVINGINVIIGIIKNVIRILVIII